MDAAALALRRLWRSRAPLGPPPRFDTGGVVIVRCPPSSSRSPASVVILRVFSCASASLASCNLASAHSSGTSTMSNRAARSKSSCLLLHAKMSPGSTFAARRSFLRAGRVSSESIRAAPSACRRRLKACRSPSGVDFVVPAKRARHSREGGEGGGLRRAIDRRLLVAARLAFCHVSTQNLGIFRKSRRSRNTIL